MINYEYGSLFQETSIKRQLLITSAAKNLTITNEELYEDDFELSEGICSGEQLVFGSFESARIKFKASGISTSLKGQWLDVSMVLGGNSFNPFRFGSFKVDSDKPSADRRKREYVAYDVLHDVIGADVARWYQGLVFPMTMREFRDSFFAYFNIVQEEFELVNDGMTVEKTINPESISGKDVLSAILEINGCFGHINRNGNFRYVYLKRLDIGAPLSDTLYPSITLYPSEELFPRELNEIVLNEARYFNCTYEDFVTQKVTQLQIRKDEDDIGCIAGTEGNLYIIEDNFLVYGKSSGELTEIAEKILEKIEEVRYIPCSVTAKGNPCMEPGEGFRLCTKYQTVDSYMLSRTLKGVQNLMDTYTAEGVEYYERELNSTQRDIKELKGKTNKLIRTVDETRVEMEDVERSLWSEIVLTADQLQTRITNTEKELASSITQTAESIRTEISGTAGALRSRINQTASSIRSEISDNARMLQSRITQTAESIRSEVSDTANALQSSITQTAERISTEITRATTAEEQLSSSITQTAQEIKSEVSATYETKENASSSYETFNSSIVQNARSITAEVNRAKEKEEELSSSISLNAQKIELKVSRGNVSSVISQESGKISIESNRLSIESTYFTLTENGKITATEVGLTGKITADSGKIGGFTIMESDIHYGNKTSITSGSVGIYIGTDGMALGDKFKVLDTGALTASDVDLTGKITADSGQIGGFTITNDSIYSGSKSSLTSTYNGVYVGTDGIGCGENFYVTKSGVMHASNMELSGKITSDSGKIAGFTIASSKLYSNKSSLTSSYSGVYIGTDGIGLGSKFKVNTSGEITATGGTIGGFIIGEDKIYTNSKSSLSSGLGVLLSKSGIGFGDSYYDYTWIDAIGFHTKYSSSGFVTSFRHVASGSAGYSSIRCGSSDVIKFNESGSKLSGRYVRVGDSDSKLSFFHDSAPTSSGGSVKQTVTDITSVSSVTTSDVATKLNALLTALRKYNLIG